MPAPKQGRSSPPRKASPPPLADIILDPIVRLALAEDLGGAGDVTTDAIIDPEALGRWTFRARKQGVVAGLDAAFYAARLIDPELTFRVTADNGDVVGANGKILEMEGRVRSALMAERVMLNFIGRLAGIATLTRAYVDAVEGLPVIIACTRKTTPGLRALEKRAVKLGGGGAHRFALDDAILIKDNHIAAAGSVGRALEMAREAAAHLTAIEVEVDNLQQLQEALEYAPSAILLDNFSLEEMRQAVKLAQGQALLEASGGVSLQNVRAIAQTGIDVISVGALTHSAPALDVGLDVA